MKLAKNNLSLSVLIFVLSTVTFVFVGCGNSSTSSENKTDECTENPSAPICTDDVTPSDI
ncbi:MAG: hypothetical protein WCX75_09025 [Fibrobacteraceae bacterium]